MIPQEVEKAIIEIQNFCVQKQCENCPLFLWENEEFKDCLLSKRPDLWRLDLSSKQKYISFDKDSNKKIIIDAYSMEDARAKIERKKFNIRTLEPLAQYNKRTR
jgi:hypothetical protein